MSDSPHTIYWKNTYALSSNVTLSGYSRAAENTGFYCKELEMAFDGGVQMNDRPAVICLTHLHNDHMCNLNKLLIENPKKPIVIIPDNDKFATLLTQTLKLLYISSKFIHPESAKGQNPAVTYPYALVKLAVGSSYKFKETVQGDYYAEGLPSEHGVTSVSFGIYQMRKRCKEEYRNLAPQEYVQLKKDGIDITEHYKYPIVCYMSDTNSKPFDMIPASNIYSYNVIVMECTFLEDVDLSQAKKKNHIHWLQLIPIVKSHPEIKFILIHFSKKYTWKEVKEFFDIYQTTVEFIPNIVLWLQTGIVDYSTKTKGASIESITPASTENITPVSKVEV